MKERTYKLTEKQKKAAARWYKKGYTTHGKLSRKMGVSRQKVSNWLKTRKLGKRKPSEFWRDVKSVKRMEEISHKEATKKVKYAPKWFKKRQKKLKGLAKARDEMKQKWHRIKQGDIEPDWWREAGGEDLLEAAEYD